MKYSPETIEHISALFSLGLATALIHKAIDIETAEKLFFTPGTMDALLEKTGSEQLNNILHFGTELEDLESLMPERLPEGYSRIMNLCLELLREKPFILRERIDWYTSMLEE